MASKIMIRTFVILVTISTVNLQILREPTTFDEDLEELSEDVFGDDIDVITMRIYSNFDNEIDRTFFRTTLPWLVDNIGHYLRIEYTFSNSGRNVGPRMCAIRQIPRNTFVQSDLLRCEAMGTNVADCVMQAGLNTTNYRRCLREGVNNYVRDAQRDFDTLLADTTPVVLIRRREINVRDPMRLLRLVCQRYGRIKPPTCFSPIPYPSN